MYVHRNILATISFIHEAFTCKHAIMWQYWADAGSIRPVLACTGMFMGFLISYSGTKLLVNVSLISDTPIYKIYLNFRHFMGFI